MDIEADMHRGKTQGKGDHVTGVRHPQAKQCQGLPANARAGKDRRVLPGASERAHPAVT